jgi:hypothetical protein
MLASNTPNMAEMSGTPVTITPHERLTWDEICQRYPDTWVVAVSPQRIEMTDDADDVTIEFCTAVVVAHHKNRKSLTPFIKAKQHLYEELGTYFTGRLIPPAYELVAR